MNLSKDRLKSILIQVAIPKPPWFGNPEYPGERSITHEFMYSQWKKAWGELGLDDYDECVKGA